MNFTSHFTRNLYLLIIISLGIIFRWYHLDFRPIHHDESLYGIYGFYWFNNANTGFYKYMAMLHGPLLYFIYPFIYKIFGTGLWAVRFPMATLGSLFIFAPLIFQKYLSKNITLILVSCISLSPMLSYYSRFSRHDPLVIAEMLLMLIAIVVVQSRWKSPIFIIGLTLHFATKENSYITSSLLLGYLIYEHLILKLADNDSKTLFEKMITHLRNYKWYFLLGIFSGLFIYCYLYSAEFKYSSGILDGLYRKSLAYWFNQHNIERIKGPFSFQFLILSWHELPIILATFVSIILYNIRANKVFKIANIICYLICALLMFNFYNWNIYSLPIISLFKLKIPIDIFLLIFLIFHAIANTTHHLIYNQRKLAFWSYMFFGSFFVYSFVGEKVPWLALYPLVCGIIYLPLLFSDFINKRSVLIPVLTIIIVYGTYMSNLINFNRAGEASEFLSQVHTTHEFADNMIEIEKTASMSNPPLVLTIGAAIWPNTWYMRGANNFRFTFDANTDLNTFKFIILDYPNTIKPGEQFQAKIVNFRGWFSPNYNKMTFKDYFSYCFTHQPWSDVGYQKVKIYSRKQ